jgi:4-hydroxy-3-polyprenylbenzoate decarboxylase
MQLNDLRGFIEAFDQMGELKRVEGADRDLEIGALTELMAERRGPALLFDKIKDFPAGYRILSNPLSSTKRLALVLGLPQDLKDLDMLNAWRRKLKTFKPVPPIEIEAKDAPVEQNIHIGADVNLLEFPAPKWHELDGGRYLGTGCCVITKDPEEGWVNIGTYRGMVYDKNLVGVKLNKGKHGRIMMEKYHARGEACPIAIAYGQDLSLWFPSAISMKAWGVSEYDFAGWLRGEPVEVFRGQITGLPLPATAEVVIEGEIPLPGKIEPRQEGPFGEWPGYYTDITYGVVPIVEVKAVHHRSDPIILGVPPLKPPARFDFAIPLQAAAIWDELESAGISGIKGVWIGLGMWGPLWLVIAITQQYAGHAKQAAVAAVGCRTGAYGGRFVITVDDDIDITQEEEVIWALATRCDVGGIDILRNIWTTPADLTLSQEKRNMEENVSSRAIIDACKPYSRMKAFPETVRFKSEYREAILKKWHKLFT